MQFKNIIRLQKMKKKLGGTGELETHLLHSQKLHLIKTALFLLGKLLRSKLGSNKIIPLCGLFLVYFTSVTNRVNLSPTNTKGDKFLKHLFEKLIWLFHGKFQRSWYHPLFVTSRKAG